MYVAFAHNLHAVTHIPAVWGGVMCVCVCVCVCVRGGEEQMAVPCRVCRAHAQPVDYPMRARHSGS